MTLKGNTFTVDNRKSPLFLYSAGTTNHTTQYMSCRTETQVQFLSTIWPSPCWNSAAGKGFKHSFKASTHFVSSCLCQLTFFPLVILAMLLLVTFHFAQRERYLPSGVFPLSPSRYTAQHWTIHLREVQIISQLSHFNGQRIKCAISIHWGKEI